MFNPSVDKKTGYRTDTMLCMPVIFEGQIEAVAQLINKKYNNENVPYTAEDVELFESFAAFAGVSLRNCREHAKLLKAVAVTEVIVETASKLGEAMEDSEEIFQIIIYHAKTMSSAGSCTLFLVDKEHHEIYVTASDTNMKSRGRIGSGIAGSVALTGECENIIDAYADPRFSPAADAESACVTKTMLCTPVFSRIYGKQEVIAVLQQTNKTNPVTGEITAFNNCDVDNARRLATFAGVGIMNSRTYQHALTARDNVMKLIAKPKQQDKNSRSNFKTITDCMVKQSLTCVYPQQEFDDMTTPEFDLHQYKNDTTGHFIIPMLVGLFDELGYIKKFHIDKAVLTRFLLSVKSMYRNIPYHNFYHAVDVAQTMFCYIRYAGIGELVDDLYCFVMLVTALVHDIDHMGLNNSFHFKAETPMGQLSCSTGSTSVLEVHHCNLTIELLSNPATDIFLGLSEEQKKLSYKLLIDCILATDMAKHKELVEYSQQLFTDGVDENDVEHVKTLLQVTLKGADISNISKPFRVCCQWAICVTEEFYMQGDVERELGKEVNPMNDRETQQALANNQLGFIDYVGLPYFEMLEGFLPAFKIWTDAIKDNRSIWEKKASQAQY